MNWILPKIGERASHGGRGSVKEEQAEGEQGAEGAGEGRERGQRRGGSLG
jgi:hypothetical protein